MFDHMQALIDQRHRQPEDDLISHLIQGAAETGATDELIKISACSLLSAGSDTTRHGAVLALRTLLTHPEVRAQLAADSWRQASDAVIDGIPLAQVLAESRGGVNLRRIGLTDDIEAAARIDVLDVVPELTVLSWRIHGDVPRA